MLPQFGLRVSVLLDANGANTTAAAAVRVAGQQLSLSGTRLWCWAAPVPWVSGWRGCWRAREPKVRVGSRQLARSAAVCDGIRQRLPAAQLEPVGTGTAAELTKAVRDQALIVAAGAAGAVLLPKSALDVCNALKVAIDLNAVPPLGIEGIGVGDTAIERDGIVCYGAIGVGATKMKLHRAAIARLFESNDLVLDAEEVFAIPT